MRETILIVEDEKDIVRMLEYNLKQEGFRTLASVDGKSAINIAVRETPGLILLDLMLPEINGLEVCRALKTKSKTAGIPIIMLTAKSQELDKVVGLELGADDYVTKPFNIRELIARIKAVLRRTQRIRPSAEILKFQDLVIDLPKIRVMVKGKPVELTKKEFELLRTLVEADGRVLSRDYLLDHIWGLDHAADIMTRTVDAHITTLRKKLKSASIRIVTVKNYGYSFNSEE